MSKIWSSDEIKRLIELYEIREILWNVKCVDYRDRVKKFNVLEEMGVEFSCSGGEVQRKLHNLRNQVSQELKKMKSRKSGSGTDENYQSNWPYFSAMKFVIPGLTACSTQSNLVETYSNSEVDEENTEASEKPEENKDTAEGNLKQPTSKSSKRYIKRKREEEDSDALKAALQVLAKGEPDEHDRFGEYVALELRTLRSEYVRRKLKNEIRKAIVGAADEDESYSLSSSISATNSNSSGYNFFVQSPPTMPEASQSYSSRDLNENFNFAQFK